MYSPLITIGIATYNSVDSVHRCIKSALDQTLHPIEIVVVDDFSLDGTYEELTKLALNHKEIRIFRNDRNYGVGHVRNKIIKEAKGVFLAFFDDDDESLINRLELQYKRIIDYEKKCSQLSLIICHSSRRVNYPNGSSRNELTLGTRVNTKCPNGIMVAKKILLGEFLKDGYGACPTCSQMARLSTYQSIGGFDPNFRRSEDTDLNIRLALKGAHFVGIKEPLVSQNMTKTSDKNLDIEFRYTNQLLKKHKNFIDEYSSYSFCLSWLKIKYLFHKRNFFAFILSSIRLIIQYPRKSLNRFFLSLRSIKLNIDFALFHR